MCDVSVDCSGGENIDRYIDIWVVMVRIKSNSDILLLPWFMMT